MANTVISTGNDTQVSMSDLQFTALVERMVSMQSEIDSDRAEMKFMADKCRNLQSAVMAESRMERSQAAMGGFCQALTILGIVDQVRAEAMRIHEANRAAQAAD